MDLRLKVVVHYPNGKKKKIIDRKSKSFVIAFIDNIYSVFANTMITVKDITGTDRNIYYNLTCNSPAGNTNHGIVVGNGYGDVNPDDYKLINRINNGTGNGELIYSTQFHLISQGSGNKRYIEYYRYFANYYRYEQIVRECGIYGAYTSYYFCLVRDMLGGIKVPSKGGITIYYKYEISY